MKIGILTMHKVLNYGSALQAYALQRYISELGHDVKLIDYIFPNTKKRRSLISIVKTCFGGRLLKKDRFNKFYKEYFVCTNEKYISPEELNHAKLDFDILITGSDQVWNPIHIKNDYSFFFPFAPKNYKKVSYASSFSVAELPDDVKPIYKEHLKTYMSISVRESSGIRVVEDLLGHKVKQVCDPTLLLTKENWIELVKDYKKPYKEPYILAYILGYAYNPYPEIDDIINKIQKELGLHLIILDGRLHDFQRRNTTVIKTAGPLEFINLVKNASFIITTSFHGTAFALNFEIPFYSVIKDNSGFDTRMVDLLEKVGCSDRILIYNDKSILNRLNVSLSKPKSSLDKFRLESKAYIINIL